MVYMTANREISPEPEQWKRPATETRRIYFRGRYKCIARAIDFPVEVVMTHAVKFEEAAHAFQHDGRGELNKPADRRKELQRISRTAERFLNALGADELQKILPAAERLLKVLGVTETADAVDGPSPRVRELLFYADTVHEDEVILATERIGHFADVTQAIEAARTLKRAADEAAEAVGRLGDLISPTGHQAGPLTEWIAALLEIYEKLTGKDPGTSIGAPDRQNAGKAGGPLIRFLQAAAGPLGIEKSEHAWRSLIRGVLARRQKKFDLAISTGRP
jgi:hypothetical protein